MVDAAGDHSVGSGRRRKAVAAVMLLIGLIMVIVPALDLVEDYTSGGGQVSLDKFGRMLLEAKDPMGVRKLAIDIVTRPQSSLDGVWVDIVMVNRSLVIGADQLYYVRGDLREGECIEGTLTADNPVNFYVMDEGNFTKYRAGLSFYYYVIGSAKSVLSFSPDWCAPDSGTYYVVVEPVEGGSRVSLRLHVQSRGLARGVPSSITSTEEWAIWAVNAWVSTNINYIRDPNFELVQRPNETLKLGAGDCDDIAVLTSSLLEASGIKTAFALVDTDGDGKADHVSVLALYPDGGKEFLDWEERIIREVGVIRQLEKAGKELDDLSIMWITYNNQSWLVVDPLFQVSPVTVGMIEHTPYKIVRVVGGG
ncbi:MAG: hypothetical protein F7C35_02505 [Desulfurococcales archaeon]|nr:hypothetical protein [Desulfurococcales archaeon]